MVKTPNINAEQLDLKLSVLARVLLMLECHPMEELIERVFKPTRDLLEIITTQKPGHLVLIRETPTINDISMEGKLSQVDIVAPNKQTAYLATVRNREESEKHFQKMLEIFRDAPEQITVLKERGPMAMVPTYVRFHIPTTAEILTETDVELAIRRYLDEFAPALALLQIYWPEVATQEGIKSAIWRKARQDARAQTEEEKQQAYGELFFM